MNIQSDEQLQSVLAECYASTKVCSKVLFPERFELPFSDLHDQIFELLDNDELQRVAIAAPRGFGKTTIDTIAHPAKRILFREKKFIVPVSATATKAVMDAENLKHELLANNEVQQLFGPMKTDNFSKEMWVTQSGTCVMPRGAGQQIRGILYHRYRPDLIIVDDLENSESVENEELRTKLKAWFFADLCNSINRARKDWKIIVVGTILHEDSLLVNLLEDPSWASIQLSICDDNLKSNWPDFMSDKAVKELYEDHKRRGQLDEFYREYRNIPVSTEDATFRPSYFKEYSEPITVETKDDKGEKIVANIKDIINVVIVDPAKTVKIHSAESAIVGIGVSRSTQRIYIRDIVSDKFYPDEIYNEMFNMVARLKAFILAVEVTSLNEFIVQPIKNEIMKRGLAVNLLELKARGKKEERIAALVPYYRQGYIYHNSACCKGLESQLMAFPRSRLWDIMDATAYIVEVLELEAHYFDPPDWDDKDIESEYDDLDNDSMIGDWRVAV